ncbi:MAG TPA: STT3 domain-containing protein [Candidatus Nanoarchaeia archaeon]|nr:STT3 domain-containing protein [Candidatus Nanoarchaeia archaeon]
MSKKNKKTEDTFEVDLSKINPFKKKADKPSQKASENAESTIDFSSIRWDHKKITLIILLLIPLLLTGYFRYQPQELAATDNWAQSAVHNSIRNNIADEVQKQFPNLPSQNKNELVDQQLNQALKENQALIEQQVQQISLQFKKSFQGQTAQGKDYTLLGDLDSYYWLRYAENIVDHGSYCDQIKDGKCWDNYIFAPNGGESESTLHPYMIAFTYSILHFFNSDVTVLTASYFTVWWGAILCALAAFFIGKRMVNEYAGFIAATALSVNALFITRTSGSDNDIWNIVLSLLITWMALEAFEAKTHKKTLIYSALAGLLVGVFAFAWQGWWYLFDFVLIAVIGYVVYLALRELFQHKKIISYKDPDLTHTATFLVMFILFSGIFVTVFLNSSRFMHDPLAPINFGVIKNAANPSLWPNVYTTVAELNPGSISELLNSGTNTSTFRMAQFYFLLALFGILLLLVKNFDVKTLYFLGGSLILYLFLVSNKGINLPILWFMVLLILPIFIRFLMLLFHSERIDLKLAILLIIWFAGTAYATTKGIRFILLFLPAFAVAFGVCLGRIIEIGSHYFGQDSSKKLLWSRLILFLILLLLLITPIKRGWAASTGFFPTIDRGWVDTLTEIREKSAPNAIINSWWDFGHWFKYWAKRGVTLDGATQNHPNAHWLGELMATPNEKESVAILRMLDCGNNDAFEEVDKKLHDTEYSHALVHEIILQSKEQASKTLQEKGYGETEAQAILKYTHCDPPEDYFITSEDMVGKAGVWGHFGLWNFNRAWLYNNLKDKTPEEAVPLVMSRYGLPQEKAQALYYEVAAIDSEGQANQWISPWPNFATGWHSCQNTTTEITCNLGMNIGNQNGQNMVLEKLLINTSKKEWDVKLLIGAYANNLRTGEGLTTPDQFYVASDQIRKMNLNASNSITIGFLFDTVGGYRLMAMDPLFVRSTFTKLFYLDGRYMNHFDKFSDKNTIGGDRILVWKVNWNGHN